MPQEPLPISGLWFRANAQGTRIIVLVEFEGRWYEVAEFKGAGDGPTSHIVEPLGLRVAIQEGKPAQIH